MSQAAPLSPPAEEIAVVFKAKKNRKQLRSRPTVDDDAQSLKSPTHIQDQIENSVHKHQHQKRPSDGSTISNSSRPTTANSHDVRLSSFDDDNEAAPAVRKAKRQRLMGVAFRVEAPRMDDDRIDPDTDLASPMALVPSSSTVEGDDNSSAAIAGGIRRFAPQTGVMGAMVNQHMERYVESRLTSRRPSAPESTPICAHSSPASHMPLGPSPTLQTPILEGQKPTQSGKLMEVDLGDEARMKNLSMIERARRGENIHDADPASNKRKRRDRRGSEDIKRDQMVDSFLHENRLDVYDVPKQTVSTDHDEIDDLAADDRVAEKFRRDFIDAMSQRVRRRRAARAPMPVTNRPGAKRDDEVLKGPKLGGSRNVRAQMRDILLQKEKEKERKR